MLHYACLLCFVPWLTSEWLWNSPSRPYYYWYHLCCFTFRITIITFLFNDRQLLIKYRGGDKSLARPGRKHARKHVRDARDFNNIETRAIIKFFFSARQRTEKIHAILTETLACFLPGRAKDLSALPYLSILFLTFFSSTMFQMHLRPFLNYFLGSMFLIHKE